MSQIMPILGENNRQGVPMQYFKDTEVAEALKISRNTVWRLVKTGDLPPPRKIGGSSRWLLPTDDRGNPTLERM